MVRNNRPPNKIGYYKLFTVIYLILIAVLCTNYVLDLYHKNNNFEKARRIYLKCLEVNPNSEETCNAVFKSYL